MAMQRRLLERLDEIPGSHGPGELATLSKDIEKPLIPYGGCATTTHGTATAS